MKEIEILIRGYTKRIVGAMECKYEAGDTAGAAALVMKAMADFEHELERWRSGSVRGAVFFRKDRRE